MKNNINTLILVVLCSFVFNAAHAQFRIRNDEFIQIGYEDYRALTFGEETALPNNGKYSVEYWSQAGGLNFWKPWPTQNSGNYILFLRDDKNIGIGTAGTSAHRLDVNGSIRCIGLNNNSDRRLKKNILPLENSLEILSQLKPVSYDYDYTFDKNEGLKPNDYSENKAETMKNDSELVIKDEDRMGFIAQEVREVLPQLVSEDEKGFLSLNYVDLIPVLVDALNEQQIMIEKLEEEVAQLKGAQLGQPESLDLSGSNLSSSSYLLNNLPNPFSEQTQVKYSIDKNDLNKSMMMVLHDSAGKEVFSQELQAQAGLNTMTIDGQGIANGAYFLSLIVDGQVVGTNTVIRASR